MDEQEHSYLGDDGEIEDDEANYREGRKPKPPYRREGCSPIIIALIGAAGVIIAALIAVVVPVGSEAKPLICNIVGSSWAVCNGSIIIESEEVKGTQIALEQRETAFAQTQTAVVPTQVATDPPPSPTFMLTSTSRFVPSATPLIIPTRTFVVTPTVSP